jgi:tetratricopeptide (TPR) repeat protein
MYLLGHEDELRATLGFPPIAQLWGKAACRWKSAAAAIAAIDQLQRNPELACQSPKISLAGKSRIAAVDELFVHARFRAAHDLATYLASTPGILREKGMNARGWIVAVDLRVILFLRLKAIVAAVEGGLYQRARAELMELEGLQHSLPASDEQCQLLRANIDLVWGRLLQLFFLAEASTKRLANAEGLFKGTRFGVPRGLGLLRSRAGFHSDYRVAQDHLQQIALEEKDEKGLHIYGDLADHYRHYLRGRAALQAEMWSEALKHFNAAKSSLEKRRHGTFADPIRMGYTILGQGQTLTGRGQLGDKSEIEQGLRQLLEARWLFREHEFTPGEYVAYRHYSQAMIGQPQFVGSRVPLLKEVMRLGVKSNVPAFSLQSSVSYAEELYRGGRPNAAQVALKEVLRLEHDDLALELMQTTEWRKALTLDELTRDARDNGVEPLDKWGLSLYAERERDFVRAARKEMWLVSAYGPVGSGRRQFLNRVSEAREQDGSAWVVRAKTGHAKTSCEKC